MCRLRCSTAHSGTATNGTDYLLQPGTITFAPGETSKTFTLSIINDTLIEPNETVIVTLSNPSHATLGQASATYTIIDDDQLPTIQFVDSASQGSEAGAQVFIPIKLSIPYVYPVTVKYSVIGGTAQAGVDYTLPEGQITFAPGETSKVVPVTIINDTLSETGESIIIYVQPVTNALYGQQSVHVYTILDDDPPIVGFASSTGSGQEGGSSDIIVYLSKVWTLPVTVNVSLTGGSAVLGTDYVINLGSLTFAPGETTKTISMSTINDAIDELDESVVLELSQPSNATLGQGTFTYTILDDDPPPQVGFERQSSTGSESTSSAMFTVLLSEASSLPVTVNYASTGGSAASGIDYDPLAGSITFAPGETSKTISLIVLNDQLFESNETVQISLTGAVNASLHGNLTHTYTIADDDTVKVSFDLDAAQGIESTLAPVVWVRLAAALTTTTQVNYAVTGGTAARGQDFTLNNGTLIFAPGQTAMSIPLKIVNDSLDEDNETVTIELSNPLGGIALGAKTVYTYTILDNDVPPSVSFSSAASALVESNVNATVTVKLSAASGRGVDIGIARTGGTATPDADYVFSQGTVHFNPGEVSKTFAIKVLQDTLDENDETLILALNSNANAQLGSLTKYTLTIKDDDAPPKVGFALAGSAATENAGYVDIVVQLSAPSGKAVTVKLSAGTGSTALVNKDYQPFTGTLTFNPGETQKTLRINIINDAVKEQSKLLKLLLSAPANATLGAITQHVLTLADDD
ncbi:MAG: Calx-beta domain-containing protein [Gemmatales bacterium]